MRRLELDFRRPPPARPAGWLLLVAGLAVLGFAVAVGQRIDAETAAQEAAVREIVAALPEALLERHPPGAGPRADEGALAQLQRVQARIDNRPWQQLFATLESLASEDVALLSLTPDAGKRQLRIAAEARNLGAMLAYHRRLEDTPALRDVSLVNHEFAEQVQGRPVRFSLVAAWVGEDARP